MFSAIRTGVMTKKGVAAPPAAPEVVGTQTFTSSVAAASHSIPLPADIQAGELLVVFVTTYSYNSAPTPNAGWSSTWGMYASIVNVSAYYKIASGSDTLTVTTGTTSKKVTSIAYRISNANSFTANGIDYTAVGTSAELQYISVPAVPNLVIAAIGLQTTKVCTAGSAGYSGFTRATAGTSQCETAACYLQNAPAGTVYTPGPFTVSSAAKYVAFSCLIKQV